jgi:hypothetical protein
MNLSYARPASSPKRDYSEPLTFNFAQDLTLAERVGEGELLQCLRAIIAATDRAQSLLHDETNQLPDLLALIRRSAAQSYIELMRSIAFR